MLQKRLAVGVTVALLTLSGCSIFQETDDKSSSSSEISETGVTEETDDPTSTPTETPTPEAPAQFKIKLKKQSKFEAKQEGSSGVVTHVVRNFELPESLVEEWPAFEGTEVVLVRVKVNGPTKVRNRVVPGNFRLLNSSGEETLATNLKELRVAMRDTGHQPFLKVGVKKSTVGWIPFTVSKPNSKHLPYTLKFVTRKAKLVGGGQIKGVTQLIELKG